MGNNSIPEIEALSLELHGCACLKLPFPAVTLYAQCGLRPLWAEPLNRLEHRSPERQEIRSVKHECDSYTPVDSTPHRDSSATTIRTFARI
jgi:hypothetical protein